MVKEEIEREGGGLSAQRARWNVVIDFVCVHFVGLLQQFVYNRIVVPFLKKKKKRTEIHI